jgi:hypothetical protein
MIQPKLTGEALEQARQKAREEMRAMSPREKFQLAVDAGIYTPDGKLTEPYTNNEPSLYHPKD